MNHLIKTIVTMRLQPILILLMTLLLAPQVVIAQNTPELMVEEFFNKYQEESISAAIDQFFGDNPWVIGIEEDVQKLKSRAEGFFSVDFAGEYYGYEILATKSLGEHYRKITCLVRFDRQPFRFVFVAYRPNGRWKGQNFFFSDKVEETN